MLVRADGPGAWFVRFVALSRASVATGAPYRRPGTIRGILGVVLVWRVAFGGIVQVVKQEVFQDRRVGRGGKIRGVHLTKAFRDFRRDLAFGM